MCCFGGSSAGESGWVGVREVMEEIRKDQVRKGLICSAQELGIFPEGTLCVCVERDRERERADLSIYRLLLLQHRGGWKS